MMKAKSEKKVEAVMELLAEYIEAKIKANEPDATVEDSMDAGDIRADLKDALIALIGDK